MRKLGGPKQPKAVYKPKRPKANIPKPARTYAEKRMFAHLKRITPT